MSEQTVLARGWSIEGFRGFWAKPDPVLIPRVREICAADIVGYWPTPLGVARGAVRYLEVIAAVATVCPDLSLSAPDYAREGELHFVRWVASGTGPDGVRFAFNGIDRMRLTPEGRVAENYICSDGPLFAWAAAMLGG